MNAINQSYEDKIGEGCVDYKINPVDYSKKQCDFCLNIDETNVWHPFEGVHICMYCEDEYTCNNCGCVHIHSVYIRKGMKPKKHKCQMSCY